MYPSETSWTLERVDGDESLCEVPADAQAGGPYSGQYSTHVKDASLCRGGTFRWSIADSWGDGTAVVGAIVGLGVGRGDGAAVVGACEGSGVVGMAVVGSAVGDGVG